MSSQVLEIDLFVERVSSGTSANSSKGVDGREPGRLRCQLLFPGVNEITSAGEVCRRLLAGFRRRRGISRAGRGLNPNRVLQSCLWACILFVCSIETSRRPPGGFS